MNAYLFPISTAAMVFPLVAVVLTVPYILYSYRRYGSISILRSIILFSFLVYLQCAYYLTTLPLPDPAEVATWTGPHYQIIPFAFIFDPIAHASFDLGSPRGWISLLTSSYVYEPVFNVLLTLPFGTYLAYYFKASLRKVLLLSLALSLFFELSQLSGLFGVYSRPYRLADVDDLILNTLGGVIGYFAYTRFLRFLPSRERIDQRSTERSTSVGYLRRFTALLVDNILVGLVAGLATVLLKANGSPVEIVVLLTVFLVYYPLFALLTRGKTPGKALVRIRLETVGDAQPFWLCILLRYLLRNVLMVLYRVFFLLMDKPDTTYQGALLLAALLVSAFLLLDFFLSLRTKRGKRLWYEMLTGTRNVNSLQTGS
jgi:glycopeptide antibiotics resistance protein